MVKHAFVDGRAARNPIHSRAGETFGGEFLKGGGENPFATPLRISRSR
jgi:hypothetical protein